MEGDLKLIISGTLNGQEVGTQLSVKILPIPPTPNPPIPPAPAMDYGGYRPQLVPTHGMDTKGGRGPGGGVVPVIIRVNTLADSGSVTLVGGDGSLLNPFVYTAPFRQALTFNAPRFILPEWSGYYTFNGRANITSPYFTVAGQTAPGHVCIKGAPGPLPGTTSERGTIYVATHNSIFQHIAIRPGDVCCNSAIQYYNLGNASNVMHHNVLDHCSITWAQDEGVGINKTCSNIAVWRSIVAEILEATPNTGGCTGGGTSGGHGIAVSDGVKNVAILQNILAHNHERNPQVDGGTQGAVQNNIIYNPRPGPWFNRLAGGAYFWRVDGNYFKRDSINPQTQMTAIRSNNAINGSQLYLNDNVFDNGPVPPPFTEFALIGYDPRVGIPNALSTIPGYTILTGQNAYTNALLVAGARPKNRDAVDTRIVQTVTERTGTFVNTVSQVGGYPTLPEIFAQFSIPANPFEVMDAVGRTRLELVLEDKAKLLEP